MSIISEFQSLLDRAHPEFMKLPRAESKDECFLIIARLLGLLGTCPRKAVGAVIVHHGRCISWGYNGAPPGLPHCEENGHGWLKSRETVPFVEAKYVASKNPFAAQEPGWYKAAEIATKEFGCRNATHAEANALAFAAREGISTVAGTLFVSVAPCETCARLLIAAGIGRVVYAEEYRDPAGLNLLREGGVQIG